MQNDLLLRVLAVNEAGAFGRQHRFERVRSYADFVEAVPLCNYARLAPFIDRCRQGQTQALFGPGQQIVQFALTSGTTARAKYIPVTRESLRAYRRGWDIWGVKAISDHPESYLRKVLQVSSPACEQHAAGGTPCGAISGLLAEQQRWVVRRFYATPLALARIADPTARYYTIMRLAVEQDVGFISTANPSTLLALARTAAERAEPLIRDIRDGTLDASLPVERPIRESLSLRRNSPRARELEAILKSKGQLLPRDYWRLSFLANWTGGTLGLYLPRLVEYYGSTPIRDIGLLASEGRLSIPMADNTPAGVLDVLSNFYEFVPEEEFNGVPDRDAREVLSGDFTVLQAAQLEKGRNYYVFLTNYAGLYRYNLGDLVRVADHVGTTPVIEFLSKGAHSSSLTGEKLTEKQVVDAVRDAAGDLGMAIETFILAPEWADPPCYRLYFEAAVPLPRPDVERLARLVDRRLGVSNLEYDGKRASDRLGSVQARQVARHVLIERDEKLIQANQGRREQFKHRFLYNKPLDLD